MNPDIHILRQLFSRRHETLSPGALARYAGLEEKDLAPRIEQLRAIGYDIELIPHAGYCLRQAPDILIADELQARLPDHPLARSLLVFKETRSTNDLAHRYGREGHPGNLVIVAESQTHGRGRQGRPWSSQPHLGLWFSILIRPSIPVHQSPRLTIQACLALHRAIRKQCRLHASMKWPNDLLFKGKKIAGILTEAHLEGGKLAYSVIGIGCNVHHQLDDFPLELQTVASSLLLATGHKTRRADLLLEFLPEFERVLREDWDTVREEWKAHCLNMGQSLNLQISGQAVTGQMIDIDEDGALVFRRPGGTLETVHAGEILS